MFSVWLAILGTASVLLKIGLSRLGVIKGVQSPFRALGEDDNECISVENISSVLDVF